MKRSSALATLYWTEMRMLLRDRRTVIVSIVVPVLVLPLFFVLSTMGEKKRQKRIESRTFEYAVAGSEQELVRQLLDAPGSTPIDDQASKDEESEPASDSGDSAGRSQLLLEERQVEDIRQAVSERTIHAAVEVLSVDEARAVRAEQARERDELEGKDDAAAATTDQVEEPVEAEEDLALPMLRLVFSSDRDDSQTAMRELERRLLRAVDERRLASLDRVGLPTVDDVAVVADERDVASAGQRSGAALGRYATLFLMFFLLSGGSVVAADTLAGEKERGSLETLLTTGVSRGEIVAAKMLAVFTVGVVIVVVQLLNLLLWIGLELIEPPAAFDIDLGVLQVVLLILLVLPLAALVSGVLLLVSGRASTYKEFQIQFFPIFLILTLPAAVGLLPGLDLRSGIALIPIANLSIAVRQVMIGNFDWLGLAIVWLVSMAVAAWAARAVLVTLTTERLITATDTDSVAFVGGPELFPRHVLRWFAAMWVIVFVATSSLDVLSKLPAQLTFNLVLVFLGGSLLMAKRYRLDPQQAFALRLPPAITWPAILIAAPAIPLASLAAGRLGMQLFPLPDSALERMTETILPPDMPTWQLLLLVALLPAICEELAFRGVLQHGLRRLHPVARCLAVAGIFALFHFQLARLIPTFALGVSLAAVTLLTGSILPAMLWHLANNGAVILGHRLGVELETLGVTYNLVAAVIVVLALLWIWRHRRPRRA